MPAGHLADRVPRRRLIAVMVLTDVVVLSALLLVTACEPKDGHVYFRNNSDQTLTLRQIRHDDTSPTGTRYFYAATAAAGTTADLRDHPREGFCLLNWEIVDQSGQVMRSIPGQICDGETVTYP